MTTIKERRLEMEIDKTHSQSIPTGVLIVPIITTASNNKVLRKIIKKNTSYFLLEADEMRILKNSTLNALPTKIGFEFVVGVWKRTDSKVVIASIYHILEKIEYLDRLPMDKGYHIGALIDSRNFI